MARTFLRQDTQVRSSDVYSDAIAPLEATYETNPTNIEDNLNHLRSQVHNLLENHAGNWWDDLNVPSTLEAGTQRGVNDLNTSLHAVEKKRVLRPVKLLADIVVPSAVSAGETLTLTANAANTETVTVDGKVYTFQTVLTDVDGNVLIGASASDSIDNLIAAMNLAAGAGSTYATSMTAGTYTGAAGAGDTLDIASNTAGTQSNGDTVSEGLANGAWGASITSGGSGDVVILGSGELPTQTVAAVGAVTTLGTVVAHNSTFGTATLDEVVGGNALASKNLMKIFDGASGDTLFSTSGKQIWGLFQSETITDGHTITDTTTTRVQITFVQSNATNDDLELTDGTDIGGKTINYCYNERVRFEDLNEGDFLDSAAIDIPVGAGQTTRDQAYINQGTTAVELSTNADLDLAAGLEWAIRDNLDADLLKIIEGSTGGTSAVEISAGTDTFDSNAAANDFLNGGSFDTGTAGTTINVGVTANQIDSGGALAIQSASATDLTLFGQGEIIFNDGNMVSEGTWAGPGVKLSEDPAEVAAYGTAFGGEVSLMNAIVQAQSSAASFAKACANVTSTTGANTDISLGDGNLDAALGDLSGGTFTDDHDVYLNGQLLRSGVDLNANHDVYPGTDLNNTADGQLKFEFNIKNNDVICVISRA